MENSERAERQRLKKRAEMIADIREALRSDYANSFDFFESGPAYRSQDPEDGAPATIRVRRLEGGTYSRVTVTLEGEDSKTRTAGIWDLPDEALEKIRRALPGPDGSYGRGVTVQLDPKVFNIFKYRAANAAHRAPSALLRDFMAKYIKEGKS